MDIVSVLQAGVEVIQLRRVDREGIKDAFIEVLMDSVVKVAGVTLAVVIHEELLRQDVPGDIRVQVPVFPHQLGDDVDVNTGVEVLQFLMFLRSTFNYCWHCLVTLERPRWAQTTVMLG